MIDLHIHTTYSDGADSLIEVLKKAEESNLEYISITDHDNCKAYNELRNIDVKDYYYESVLWAYESAIANGTSDVLFSPDATCTRAQALTFIWRYFD